VDVNKGITTPEVQTAFATTPPKKLSFKITKEKVTIMKECIINEHKQI